MQHGHAGSFGAAPRVRAFDGLRGLAVAAVVAFHAGLAGARGGFLGVSAFFTLSGYLITSLLLDEHARTGRVSLRAFWARRARRLLPAAYAALAGILVYGATVGTAEQVRALRGDVLSALAYVANWRFHFAGRSYESLFNEPSPVLHFWSLAIEEQFYVLFPLVLLGVLRVARGRRTVAGALLLAGAGASVAAGAVLASGGTSRVYYGTDTRAAELLVGALCALASYTRTRRAPRRRRGAQVATAVVGFGALATMLTWWATADRTDGWLYRGGFALHAVLTAAVITAARVPGPFARLLGARPLEALGRVSYGVYLFHWPVFGWLTPDRTGLGTAPLLALRGAVTLTLAAASYTWLEQPILHGRRLRGRWPRVATAASAAALSSALLAVTWSPPPPRIVLRALDEAAAPQEASLVGSVPPAPGAPRAAAPAPAAGTAKARRARPPARRARHRALVRGRPLRILLVGDSVGLTLGRGLALWARDHGAQVVNLGRVYCPLGRDLGAQEGYGTVEHTRACNWTAPWTSTVGRFDPDVTIVAYTIWEGAPRKLDGRWRRPGDPALDAWQLAEYQAAADVLRARGGHVVWLTAPCDKGSRVEAGHPLWYVNRRTIPRLADTRRSVHVVDLANAVCRDGSFLADFRGTRDFRPDGAHFSDAGARAVAEWLMPIVLGHEPVPRYPRER